MITRNNYEIYFIDYMEGNLSDKEITMVDNFLKENLDLKEEFSQFSSAPQFESTEKVEIDFSYLKKNNLIDEQNEEDFFIGRIEGDLSDGQEKALDLYLKENPKKVALLTSFENTKLSPQVVVFPNKKSLKRTPSIGFYYYLTSGVAACILALLYFNLNIDSVKEIPIAAQKNQFNIEFDSIIIPNEQIIIEEKSEIKQLIIPNRKKQKLENLAQKNSIQDEPVRDLKEVPEIKNKLEKVNKQKEEIFFEANEEFNDKSIAINSVPNKEIIEPIVEPTKSVKEYAKEKSINFIKEKTSGKKDESESLLAFATKKAEEIPLPKFIDYDNQKSEKQQVRTIKVGNLFSIKRKTRI